MWSACSITQYTMQTVLVVEAHTESRDWLQSVVRTAFGSVQVEEAGSLEEARARLSGTSPALVLVNLCLSDGNALSLIDYLHEQCPDSRCIVVTAFDDDRHLFSALGAGIDGYLLLDQPLDDMVGSLRGVLSGRPPLSPVIARRLLRYFRGSEEPERRDREPLSARESEVLTLLSKGMSRADIAELLNVSTNTTASHIKAIYRKLNVSGRAEATLEAVRLGLVGDNGRSESE